MRQSAINPHHYAVDVDEPIPTPVKDNTTFTWSLRAGEMWVAWVAYLAPHPLNNAWCVNVTYRSREYNLIAYGPDKTTEMVARVLEDMQAGRELRDQPLQP